MEDMRLINASLKKFTENESNQSEASTHAETQKSQKFNSRENFWDDEIQNHVMHDDTISMNSFNSSMNFARLQNSINFRATTHLSEGHSYFKKHKEPIVLKDPKPVQEANIEEEQSEKEQPRSSVASLISMIEHSDKSFQQQEMVVTANTNEKTVFPDQSVMYHGDCEEYPNSDTKKFDDLRQRAQKLKNQKKMKKKQQNKLPEEEQNLLSAASGSPQNTDTSNLLFE